MISSLFSRNCLCLCIFPLHFQPLPGLSRQRSSVGSDCLLFPLHHRLPVWLGRHSDLAPLPHPGAGVHWERQGGADCIQVRWHHHTRPGRECCLLTFWNWTKPVCSVLFFFLLNSYGLWIFKRKKASTFYNIYTLQQDFLKLVPTDQTKGDITTWCKVQNLKIGSLPSHQIKIWSSSSIQRSWNSFINY